MGQINDDEYEFLVNQGITPAHINDMRHDYFHVGIRLLDNPVGKIISSASVRRIGLLGIGDSNWALGGTGFDHGFQYALSKLFGLYATGVHSTGENGGAGQALGYYSQIGDIDPATAETGASATLDSYMDGNLFPQNYSYLAAGTFTQGMGLFIFAPGTDDPYDTLNSDFRFHFCYGTFAAGAGDFRPGVRLETPPYTNIITGPLISTNTGVEGIEYTYLDTGVVGIPRVGQICGRFSHVGNTVNAPFLSYFVRA